MGARAELGSVPTLVPLLPEALLASTSTSLLHTLTSTSTPASPQGGVTPTPPGGSFLIGFVPTAYMETVHVTQNRPPWKEKGHTPNLGGGLRGGGPASSETTSGRTGRSAHRRPQRQQVTALVSS